MIPFLRGINSIAWDATCTFDEPVRRHISDGALESYWRKKGTFDPSKANIVTWLSTVYRNEAIDYLRYLDRNGSVRNPVSSDELEENGGGVEDQGAVRRAASEAAKKVLQETGECISALLEDLCLQDRKGSRVNYTAVFALATRARVVKNLLDSAGEIGPPAEEAYCLAEKLIQWPQDLGAGVITKDGICADQIWKVLKEKALSPSPAALCEVIQDLLASSVRFTTAKWYTWEKRAKERARKGIEQDLWEKYLAPFHPDHRKSDDSNCNPA